MWQALPAEKDALTKIMTNLEIFLLLIIMVMPHPQIIKLNTVMDLIW